MPIIESIPNVSEGRRPEVVEAIAAAIRAVPGVRLLDHSSDPSHNRSVITLVGDTAVPTPAQVRNTFAAAPPGQPVLIAVTRGGTYRVMTLSR